MYPHLFHQSKQYAHLALVIQTDFYLNFNTMFIHIFLLLTGTHLYEKNDSLFEMTLHPKLKKAYLKSYEIAQCSQLRESSPLDLTVLTHLQK